MVPVAQCTPIFIIIVHKKINFLKFYSLENEVKQSVHIFLQDKNTNNLEQMMGETFLPWVNKNNKTHFVCEFDVVCIHNSTS